MRGWGGRVLSQTHLPRSGFFDLHYQLLTLFKCQTPPTPPTKASWKASHLPDGDFRVYPIVINSEALNWAPEQQGGARGIRCTSWAPSYLGITQQK